MRFALFTILVACGSSSQAPPPTVADPQAAACDGKDADACARQCRLGNGKSCAFEGMLVQSDDRPRAIAAFRRGCFDLDDRPCCYFVWLSDSDEATKQRAKDKLPIFDK